jgi:hypothetical protein
MPATRESRPGARAAPSTLDPAAEQQTESAARIPHPGIPLLLPRSPSEAARVLAIAFGRVQAHRWAKQLLEAL